MLDGLRASFGAAFGWDADGAVAALEDTGYQVCRGVDDEIGLVAWVPLETGLGQALVVWRFLEPEPVVFGVPHAFHELGTLSQGVELFDSVGARALVITGTHRCANTAGSGCEGETAVCAGADEPYRESDMAHAVDSIYHAAHEALFETWPGDWFVSIHGMDADGISVSDGLTGAAEDDSAVALLGAALMAEFHEETVTSCNDYTGAVVDERYCGEFDVQGRLVNGAGFPCLVAPASASGTFLHLEQSILVRAQTDRVVDALRTVFP